MLYAGLNKQKRRELSRNTGIPLGDILELVKLSKKLPSPLRLFHYLSVSK
jgi:hypothetical protein